MGVLKDRKGERYKSKSYGWAEIIEYRGAFDCDVKFDTTGTILKGVFFNNIKTGAIKDPLFPDVCGIGYFGVGKYKSRDELGNKTRCYVTWMHMIRRCYQGSKNVKNQSYEDVVVCKEWYNFQNFASWLEENWKPWMDDNWQLDKDILIKGNKIYSPETCCFVPKEINVAMIKTKLSSIGLPKGVRFIKKLNKYQPRVTKYGKRYNLSLCNTLEEAWFLYKKEKESYIRELAHKYIGKIDYKVYATLLNFTA